MRRLLLPALLAFIAGTLLGFQPASAGVEGTVTATPATIEAGETVDIVLEGDCHPAVEELVPNTAHVSHHVIATITDPNGAQVFQQMFEGAPIIEFSFSDTPTVGTYTVTADCDIEVADCAGSATACASEIVGSYTAGEFTVVEAEAAAADAAPADVVAATPTFTG